MTTQPAVVYFMQCEGGGPVKIGIARDAEKRRSDLQCGCPFPLRILKLVPCSSLPVAYRREHELHRRFASARSHGEWFHVNDELAALIAAPVYREPRPPDYFESRSLPRARTPDLHGPLPELDQLVFDAFVEGEWTRAATVAKRLGLARGNDVSPSLRRLERRWRRLDARFVRAHEPHLHEYNEYRLLEPGELPIAA